MNAVQTKEKSSIFSLLGQYRGMIIGLIALGFVVNALTLYLPALIAQAIDAYDAGTFQWTSLSIEFGFVALGILVFTSVQVVVQTFASERVAYDLRKTLADKISTQDYQFITQRNPSKLLTNLTSDINSIQQFVSQAIVALVSSSVIFVGAAGILLYLNWQLGLAVLTIVPVIGLVFYFVISRVQKLFTQSQEVIDSLNRVISENIIGAALIRVLNATSVEKRTFKVSNTQARTVGYGIINLFSILVPSITLLSGIGTLIVVVLGGYFVTTEAMTIGSLVAFVSYVAILIFPLLVIGFIGNVIAQATASYARIVDILQAPDTRMQGEVTTPPTGQIVVDSIGLTYGEVCVLNDISFSIKPGSKTAIIGPTAAGKTQLMNILAGLTVPTTGTVQYDGTSPQAFTTEAFYPHVGFVFQDSILFNTTIRENIAFSSSVTNDALNKAIASAELDEFIARLPDGLDTVVSERGTSLSGGQKQRVMLARALALNPNILYLDDFTSRVDMNTQTKILANLETNYPKLTLISITQKIAPIESYDQIVLLMEGELLASGTHQELLSSSIEYQQIFNSQRSTTRV